MNQHTQHIVNQLRVRRSLGIAKKPRRRIPRQVIPTAIRREYARALLGIVARLKPHVRDLISELPGLIAEARRERGDALEPCTCMLRWTRPCKVHGDAKYRRDASSDRTKSIMERLERGFATATSMAELGELARLFAKRVETWQRIQLEKQVVAALGAPVLGSNAGIDAAIGQFVEANVALIRDIPDQLRRDIGKAVTRGVSMATPHERLAAELEGRLGVAEDRAKLIARDQVGKIYGQVNQIRQRNTGMSRYVWRGVLDRRARDAHVEREGEIFEWSDPPEDGHPGEPVNCRCTAEPVFDDVLDELDDEE